MVVIGLAADFTESLSRRIFCSLGSVPLDNPSTGSPHHSFSAMSKLLEHRGPVDSVWMEIRPWPGHLLRHGPCSPCALRPPSRRASL